MRFRFVLQILSLVVIVAIGAIWMKSRAAAVDLQMRLSVLTTARRDRMRNLELERDRLGLELTEINRQRQAEETTNSPVSVRQRESSPAAQWPLGVWLASREWKNEGRANPRATVATLLWAAAGGDVAAIMPVITLDEAARKRAQALYDSLPPADRQAFPTPEALMAGLTMQAIPTSKAQLSWFHQRDDDHATVGIFLGESSPSAPTELRPIPAQDNNPPTLPDPHLNKLTVLSLQRSSTGWQVIMPAAAVDLLSRQLHPVVEARGR